MEFTQGVNLELDLGSARILVAEDDEMSRKVTSTILGRRGYQTLEAADGEQALRVLDEEAVDVLLLDIGLPGLNGLDVTRRLRSEPRYATLSILLLTGHDDERDLVDGLEAGADDYLTKPVQPRVLVARVRSSLRTQGALTGIGAAHAVVAALANAIDAKDALTQAHSHRLGTFVAALGRQMGLSAVELHAVTYGALLHDVGKIGVPDAVLSKPGPLDASEWDLMRRHTEIGESITAPLVGSVRFGPIIRHHHERWDGNGYPDGLAGEAIPIGARIVGVVDAYDAMTQARVYRPARPVEVALDELRHGRGGQFDPDIADAFLGVVERIGATGDDPAPLDAA